MTIHIYFTGGPLDGAIQSFEDPGDIIEFPIDQGPTYVEWARYRKVRVEEPQGTAFRGKQGLWVYGGMRLESNDGEILAPRHEKGA